MYLNGVQLTPSHENIHNRLSVRYGINLLLVDEEGTKYEREADITIYRKEWLYNLIKLNPMNEEKKKV